MGAAQGFESGTAKVRRDLTTTTTRKMMKLQNILVCVLLGLLCASLAFAQGGRGGMGRGGPRGMRPQGGGIGNGFGGMLGFRGGPGPGRDGDRPSGGRPNGNRGPPADDRCDMDNEMFRECDDCSRDMPVDELTCKDLTAMWKFIQPGVTLLHRRWESVWKDVDVENITLDTSMDPASEWGHVFPADFPMIFQETFHVVY